MPSSLLPQASRPRFADSVSTGLPAAAPTDWLDRIIAVAPSPTATRPPGELDAAAIVEPQHIDARQWAARIARQPTLQSARELAGLTEMELTMIEQSIQAAPTYPRTDVYRHATPLGVLAVGAGALGLAADHLAGSTAGAVSGLLLGSTATAGCGLMLACLGAAMSFRYAPLRQAYARLSTFVAEIGEHHPWLYETAQLMGSEAAERYRRKVRAERGVVRGVDCYMMREIASIDEQNAHTETARSVRDRVQAGAEKD